MKFAILRHSLAVVVSLFKHLLPVDSCWTFAVMCDTVVFWYRLKIVIKTREQRITVHCQLLFRFGSSLLPTLKILVCCCADC